MLIPRLSLPEDSTSFSLHNRCATPCTDGGDTSGENSTPAVELPWDDGQQAFSKCIVIPRVLALDVVARMHAAAPWQKLLQLQVCSCLRSRFCTLEETQRWPFFALRVLALLCLSSYNHKKGNFGHGDCIHS